MKKELLSEILEELEETFEIKASAIVTRSGLPICADIPQDINAETFAAMAATILGAAETATSEIGAELPERIIVETGEYRIITEGAGEKAFLVCMTSETDVRSLLAGLDKAAEKVEKILG